eukprot:gene27908-36765_t
MSNNSYGFKYPVKYAFGSTIYSIAQVNRNYADPLLSFSSSVGEKDYSDRLLYKIGKHVCIFDPETGKQQFFDGSRQPVVGHFHTPGGATAHSHIASTPAPVLSAPTTATTAAQSSSESNHDGAANAPQNATTSTPLAAASASDGVKQPLPSGKSNNTTRHIVDVLHYAISSNAKFVSMCEVLKPEKHSDLATQISVYSLSTLNLLKTLNHTAPSAHSNKPFTCSTFCADNKMIAALTDAQWEREKLYKSAAISAHVTILRGAPCASLMLTGSGNLLQAAKESYEKFIDHVALANVDSFSSDNAHKNRRQNVYIFEGSDSETKGVSSSSAGKVSVPSPICNTHIERLVSSSKFFLLVGSNGTIITFERSDDKHEPYIESRRLSLGDVHIIGATVYPTEERMVLIANNGRLLSMQALVSFKDRIRLYNVLMNKLKPCKEAILKNCKCLKYSNGAQPNSGQSIYVLLCPHHHRGWNGAQSSFKGGMPSKSGTGQGGEGEARGPFAYTTGLPTCRTGTTTAMPAIARQLTRRPAMQCPMHYPPQAKILI